MLLHCFSMYASLALMLSTSMGFYKYLKIWNIICTQNSNGIEFGPLEVKFSYNFIISAEFCNDFSAVVVQIKPQKSGHPKRWLHRAGGNWVALRSFFVSHNCVPYQSAWNMGRPNSFLIIKNKIDTPAFILPNEEFFL